MKGYETEDIFLDNSKEFMPQIIKAGKDILVLSMISKRPMSGYDLIKKIFTETSVLLSQGTVYPILYSFEEEDILKVEYERGDMRTKMYRLTPQGMEIAQDKIDHFVLALNHFIKLLDTEATCPSSHNITNDPVLFLQRHNIDAPV